MIKIDEIDRKILRRLQKNSRITSEKLSEQVGLSPTACQRRIKRLRDEGVIVAETAQLSPRSIGRNILTVVQIALNKGGPEAIDRFKEKMLKLPEIQQIYHVTGEYDFVVILSTQDMEEYDQITRRIFRESRSIQRFQSSIVIESVKTGSEFPI